MAAYTPINQPLSILTIDVGIKHPLRREDHNRFSQKSFRTPELHGSAYREVSLMRPLGPFRKDQKGVAAIEFALLALPFFLLLFGILETAMVFVGEITVGQATERMARSVRIGEVSREGIEASDFRASLCAVVAVPLECEKLRVDLRSYSTFAAVAEAELNSRQPAILAFERGRPGEIMALQVSYEWPLHVDLVRKYLASTDGNSFSIKAVSVFRTEPFE